MSRARRAQMFGSIIFAFMCHHSLPGFIAPLSDARRARSILVGVYTTVAALYVVLCLGAAMAFPAGQLQPLYTLNFRAVDVPLVGNFLRLFPVATCVALCGLRWFCERRALGAVVCFVLFGRDGDDCHCCVAADALRLRSTIRRASRVILCAASTV